VSELSNFDERLDVLVIGSGIAGLTAALALPKQRIAVISKEKDGGGSTRLAQGGIAAALDPRDTVKAHARDTLAAAAGLADPRVVRSVTAEAAEVVNELQELGVRFDDEPPAQEGGHSAARVVHARGDATGAEISRGLLAACYERGIPIFGEMVLLELLTERTSSGTTRVVGALVWDRPSKTVQHIRASTVILATGGYGHLWAGTTSPPACSGGGLAAALRAGAQVADLEFVQFHPTGMLLGRDPRPLASEALRGAGACLRDATGEFLHSITHPGAGDLAPRDVVSASMVERMAELGSDHCFLDATPVDHQLLEAHFGTFVSTCRRVGIDPRKQWVPVSPTAHYTMGGILTDVDGRTTLEGLMAAGEVACTGLHGANRLASNSLLEGAVVGRRLARVLREARGPVAPLDQVPLKEQLGKQLERSDRAVPGEKPTWREPRSNQDIALEVARVRKAMQSFAGPSRDADGLTKLTQLLCEIPIAREESPGKCIHGDCITNGEVAEHELRDMTIIARLVAELALAREESRGAHRRSDHPASTKRWKVRQVVQLLPDGSFAVGEIRAGDDADLSFAQGGIGRSDQREIANSQQPVTAREALVSQ
jgi:L-aspartate oxidase